ncbi:MAG: PAS domain S-box protein, partial [Gemmatimonadales bacterium]
GSLVDVELTTVPVASREGRFLAGFLRDVTERKQWEATLQESEERYRALFEHSPVGIGVVDEHGDFVEFNDAMLEPGGFTREDIEAVGNVAAIYYDDTERDRLLAKLQSRGFLRREETRFRRKDGSAYDAWLSVNPVTIHDRPHRLAIVEDVTEQRRAAELLRESEARYRSLFHDSRDAVYVTTHNGSFVDVNDAALELFGYSRSELTQINARELYADAAQREVFQREADRTGAVRNYPVRLKRRDGTVRDCELTSTLRCAADGTILGYQGIVRDVTEQREAERALRASEERYRRLVEMSPDAIVVHKHGGIVFANDAAASLVGASAPEALLGANVLDFVAAQDRETVMARIRQVVTSGAGAPPEEETFVRLDGTEVAVEVQGVPVEFEGEDAVQVVARDISARKKAEAEVRAAQERMTRAFSLSPDIITITDLRTGRLVEVNEAFSRISGWSRAEAVGRTTLELAVWGTDDARADWVERLQREQRVDGMEIVLYDRAGRAHTTLVSAEVLALAGEPHLLTYVTDITNRKQQEEALIESERRFRAVFDQSVQLLGIVSLDGILEDVNATALRMIGETREAVVGRPFWETPWWTYSENVQTELRSALATAAQGETVQYEVVHYDVEGTPRVVDATITPVRDEDGTVVHLLALGHDISERKHATDALRASREQLRQLAVRLQVVREEERTTIAREIHDELGQGLTGIKMDVAWLLNRFPKTWKRVRERGHALTDLLDATIDVVRDLSSRLRPSVLDDLGLAAAVEWQASEFARRTSIDVELSDMQELPVDRERATALFRILQEALTNVTRHAAASRVQVTLSRIGREAVLDVIDNGRGLTDAEIDRPQSLGLLGMRERAVALGGEVEFRSPPDGGTHVRVRMPLPLEASA